MNSEIKDMIGSTFNSILVFTCTDYKDYNSFKNHQDELNKKIQCLIKAIEKIPTKLDIKTKILLLQDHIETYSKSVNTSSKEFSIEMNFEKINKEIESIRKLVFTSPLPINAPEILNVLEEVAGDFLSEKETIGLLQVLPDLHESVLKRQALKWNPSEDIIKEFGLIAGVKKMKEEYDAAIKIKSDLLLLRMAELFKNKNFFVLNYIIKRVDEKDKFMSVFYGIIYQYHFNPYKLKSDEELMDFAKSISILPEFWESKVPKSHHSCCHSVHQSTYLIIIEEFKSRNNLTAARRIIKDFISNERDRESNLRHCDQLELERREII